MGAKPPPFFHRGSRSKFFPKGFLSVGQESVYGQIVLPFVVWGPEYVNHSVVASVWVAVSAPAGELAGCGRLIQTASSTWGGLGRCTLVGQCVRQGLCKLYSLGELRRACVEGEEAVVALMAEPAAKWISVVQEQQQRIQTPPRHSPWRPTSPPTQPWPPWPAATRDDMPAPNRPRTSSGPSATLDRLLFMVLPRPHTLLSENMTAGRGWISLAAIILVGGTPWGVAWIALLFGLADVAGLLLQSYQIPAQFTAMTPYLATLVALYFYARRASRALRGRAAGFRDE